jgi:hypothetical protein
MHFEDTIEAPQLKLPADLLAEVSRRNKGRATDFRVEGWKPSLMERLLKLFGLS